ncbi:MAG TPA: hypothetical protein VFS67_09375 [Polyangiaceae bacterium]|jgi:hypothetical protein|nr:hypothetical protein [Polyangiaceae bacterium]
MAGREFTQCWLLRGGGGALLLGSVAYILHLVLRSVVTASSALEVASTAGSWIPIHLLGLAGAVLVLLGLPAIVPRFADAGRGASMGLALLAVSWVFFGLFLTLYGLLVLPWLARSAPFLLQEAPPRAFVIMFAAALLLWLAGTVLVAIPWLRQSQQPTWMAYALLASGVLAVLGNLVLAPSGPASNLALNLLSNMGPVPLLAAFAHLGFQLRSEHVLQHS